MMPGQQKRYTIYQNGVPKLPEIEHPLNRIGSPDKLSISGASRLSHRESASARSSANLGGRPMAFEQNGAQQNYHRPHTKGDFRRSLDSQMRQVEARLPEYIPEGVEVTVGDANKTKLPIFGSRMSDRPLDSRMGDALSRMSKMSRDRVSVSQIEKEPFNADEYLQQLRERLKSSYFEVRKRFQSNDPEGKGNLGRDALSRVVLTLMQRPINKNQFEQVLELAGFPSNKIVISFSEFWAKVSGKSAPLQNQPGWGGTPRSSGAASDSDLYPEWMEHIHRMYDPALRVDAETARQLIQKKISEPDFDIDQWLLPFASGNSGKLLKPEFRGALPKIEVFLSSREFEHFWSQIDPNAIGYITKQQFFDRLNVPMPPERRSYGNGDEKPRQTTSRASATASESGRPLLRKEIERNQSLSVEKWLKRRFREGFTKMRSLFELKDTNKTHTISDEDFLAVLDQCGLTLDRPFLNSFLARCGVQKMKEGIPYRQFLHRFQDRSEAGIAHQILTDPSHRFHRTVADVNNNERMLESACSSRSGLSAIETQLMAMFQRDFLNLMATFHQIDKRGLDVVSQEEFRAAIESRFGLEVTGEQFRSLIDKVPLDGDGNIRYLDFLSRFDTSGVAATSLWESKTAASTTAARKASDSLRSDQAVYESLRDFVRQNFHTIEAKWRRSDLYAFNSLTQESMYHLINSCGIKPELTRGELRRIWGWFVLRKDGTLDFEQMTRQLVGSPGIKEQPVYQPLKGDSDFMKRSNQLNADTVLLENNLKIKIELLWEDLYREFLRLDPAGLGYISAESFSDVLTELCAELNNYEVQVLCSKFDLNRDGRIHYLEFLKPYISGSGGKMTTRAAAIKANGLVVRDLASQPTDTAHRLPPSDIPLEPHKGLDALTTRVRQKLNRADWKNLMRTFRKVDSSNLGSLNLAEFRSVLQLANIVLNEEDVYNLMSKYDHKMSGKIPYKQFLNDTVPPRSGNATTH